MRGSPQFRRILPVFTASISAHTFTFPQSYFALPLARAAKAHPFFRKERMQRFAQEERAHAALVPLTYLFPPCSANGRSCRPVSLFGPLSVHDLNDSGHISSLDRCTAQICSGSVVRVDNLYHRIMNGLKKRRDPSLPHWGRWHERSE